LLLAVNRPLETVQGATPAVQSLAVRVPDEHFTERDGVLSVQRIFNNTFGWMCREHPTSDFGIDAHVEVVADNVAMGRVLALQIKSGESYFERTSDAGITYYGDRAHLAYWLSHSLPVVVVLYRSAEKKAYWQIVSPTSVEKTEKRWKLIVPWENQLDDASAGVLARYAEGDPLVLMMRRFEMERQWMERLRDGELLLLDVDEWVNKSSGRGDFRLLTLDRHLDEQVVRDWPFQLFPGVPYEELIPRLFPWAKIEVHEPTYDQADEDRWEQDEGIWDSEEGRYIVYGASFEDWRKRQPSGLHPYEDNGEVARWRLQLTLGPVGEAFLVLHEFLQDELAEESEWD
jgi:hypothetical protein